MCQQDHQFPQRFYALFRPCIPSQKRHKATPASPFIPHPNAAFARAPLSCLLHHSNNAVRGLGANRFAESMQPPSGNRRLGPGLALIAVFSLIALISPDRQPPWLGQLLAAGTSGCRLWQEMLQGIRVDVATLCWVWACPPSCWCWPDARAGRRMQLIDPGSETRRALADALSRISLRLAFTECRAGRSMLVGYLAKIVVPDNCSSRQKRAFWKFLWL